MTLVCSKCGWLAFGQRLARPQVVAQYLGQAGIPGVQHPRGIPTSSRLFVRVIVDVEVLGLGHLGSHRSGTWTLFCPKYAQLLEWPIR